MILISWLLIRQGRAWKILWEDVLPRKTGIPPLEILHHFLITRCLFGREGAAMSGNKNNRKRELEESSHRMIFG